MTRRPSDDNLPPTVIGLDPAREAMLDAVKELEEILGSLDAEQGRSVRADVEPSSSGERRID